MRTTWSDLDRVQRIAIERGTHIRSKACLTSLQGGTSVGTPDSWKKIWEEEVLSLIYVSPPISRTTTNSGHFSKNKMRYILIKKCSFIAVVNHLCVSAYICIMALQQIKELFSTFQIGASLLYGGT